MGKKKVGVIGSGVVGQVLAAGFVKHGFEAMIGSREPGKLAEWAGEARVKTGTFEETARFGDVVVLAVKGTVAEEVVRSIAPALAGKIVMDATNPIAEVPPTAGVLRLFTTSDESLMERLEKAAPDAQFVKAFSCVGSALMVDPELPGGPPTMFICGGDAAAKHEVNEIVGLFGWDLEDCGAAEAARAIEPLCMLWCIAGFLKNDWVHAYKVLRP